MPAVDTRPMSVSGLRKPDRRNRTEETWIQDADSAGAPAAEGHYAIGEPLGGSKGEVYAATHSHFPGVFAIKRLQTPRLFDSAAVRTLEADIERLRDLDHPHIVKTIDLGADGDTAFLVMERLEGLSLFEWLAKTTAAQVRPAETALLIRQIALGVAAAHTVGVVHRRLRPDNVFLARALGYPSGFVKILDFGLSNVQPRPAADPALDIEQALYLSPEQVEGATADEASDQFSLAAVAYRLLAGRPAFIAPDIASTLALVAEAEPPSLSRLGLVDVRTDAVLRKAMSRDPRVRFASVVEFAQALMGSLDPTDKRIFALEGKAVEAVATGSGGRRDSLGARFFEEGDRKEAGAWSATELAGEDPPDPETKHYDSFDKVPTNGRGLRVLLAITLLAGLGAGLSWYFSRMPTTTWSWTTSQQQVPPMRVAAPAVPTAPEAAAAPSPEQAAPAPTPSPEQVAAAPTPSPEQAAPAPSPEQVPPSSPETAPIAPEAAAIDQAPTGSASEKRLAPRPAPREEPPLRGYVWSPREKRLIPAGQ